MHVHGPLVVFAGAGSGKTRVITYRIANLVAMEHVAPYRILAVTFTNKAAQRDAEPPRAPGRRGARARALGRARSTRSARASCAATASSVGVPPNFVIYDTTDQRTVVNRVLKELDLDEKRYPPRAMLSRIMKEKQEGRGPDEMSVDSYMDEARAEDLQALRGHADGGRRRGLRGSHRAHAPARRGREEPRGAEAPPALRPRAGRRVPGHEPRAVRSAQAPRRARAATSASSATTTSRIYRWRGADVRNIRGFRRDFPDAQIVKLEQNYRSTGNIVRAALAVIESAREREPEGAVDRERGRRALDVVARPRRARRGGVRGEGHRAGARERRRAARDRRVLPHARAVARARGVDARRRASRTTSSVAPSSSSAPRSRTRSRTCASSSTRRATSTCCASSTTRRAASAPRPWSALVGLRVGARASRSTRRSRLADTVPELGTAAKKKLSAVSDLARAHAARDRRQAAERDR